MFPGCSKPTFEAQRARITAEASPALNLAKLFGSNDTEAMVRLITALLVPDTSSDKLRESARCSVCGYKGARLQARSLGGEADVQPFPV
ncbi:MAG TPA: hypothetical protein VGJ20_46750 [Xanthobacteraceae bacterium]